MAIKQAIWSLDDKKKLILSSLISESELEDLIADNINILSDDWLVVGRQVRTIYGGIIDLLCIDIGGNPIVVELKKGMTPREVTAQALDYASWAKEIDANELAQIYLKYNKDGKSLGEAFQERFEITLDDDNDDVDVQIVIVATDMDGSTERILKYLQGYGIDINVLCFSVFEHQSKRFLSRAWMFEPEQGSKPQSSTSHNWNGEYYFSFGTEHMRSWEDAMKYGFVSAGGGAWYTNNMQKLEPGSRIWVNIPRKGYVGVGIVVEEAKPAGETVITVDGEVKNFFELPLSADYHKEETGDKIEYIVKIDWQKTVPQSEAVSEYGFFGNQHTVCLPKADKWVFTVERLKEIWSINTDFA